MNEHELDIELALPPGQDPEEVRRKIEEAYAQTMAEMAPLLKKFKIEPWALNISLED